MTLAWLEQALMSCAASVLRCACRKSFLWMTKGRSGMSVPRALARNRLDGNESRIRLAPIRASW